MANSLQSFSENHRVGLSWLVCVSTDASGMSRSHRRPSEKRQVVRSAGATEVSRKPGDHLVISRDGGVHRLSRCGGKRKLDLFIDCTEITFVTSETTLSLETVLTVGFCSSITARV